MLVRYGKRWSTSSRTRKVGTGFSVHDFTGDVLMIGLRRTSASVYLHGRKDVNVDWVWADRGGGGSYRPAVADRTSTIFSIFFTQYSVKDSAEWPVGCSAGSAPVTSPLRTCDQEMVTVNARYATNDERPHCSRRSIFCFKPVGLLLVGYVRNR